MFMHSQPSLKANFGKRSYIDLQQIVFFWEARLNCQYFHYTLGSNMQIYSKLSSSWKKRSFFTSIFSNMEISFKIIFFLRKQVFVTDFIIIPEHVLPKKLKKAPQDAWKTTKEQLC